MRLHRTAAIALTVGFVAVTSYTLHADVRADEKTRIEFAGMMGRMMNLFGGKAAREGITSTVAVKGDRKATLNDSTGQIVDLAEEKIYDLDLKKKNYTVTTFADIRRRMEEARKKAAEEMRKEQAKPQPAAEPSQPPPENNMEVDFEIKNTGEKKVVNGFDTHQALMIVTLREKGKTLEQSGGLVMTSDMWLTPKIPAMKEVAEFDMRYAQKLFGPMVAGASAEQMASVMAMYPMLKPAMERMSKEGAKLEGTPVLTTITTDAVKSAEQLAEEAKQRESSSSSTDSRPTPSGGIGGLLGGIAKKAAAKKVAGGGDDQGKARVTFMTSTTEILKVVTDVTAADVAIPAGFKENR
jgi:hypothetical protein